MFTNATLLGHLAPEIMPSVDLISLSLNGWSEKTNSLTRTPGQFDDVMKAFKLIREEYADTTVLVITVVTALNEWFLQEIGALLERETEGLDFIWKLNFFQLIGRYNPSDALGYTAFESRAASMIDEFAGRLKVTYSRPEHDKAYLFVLPDGNMYTNVEQSYHSVGHIFDPDSYADDVLKEINFRMRERDDLAYSHTGMKP